MTLTNNQLEGVCYMYSTVTAREKIQHMQHLITIDHLAISNEITDFFIKRLALGC
jgi:hypothetical protein